MTDRTTLTVKDFLDTNSEEQMIPVIFYMSYDSVNNVFSNTKSSVRFHNGMKVCLCSRCANDISHEKLARFINNFEDVFVGYYVVIDKITMSSNNEYITSCTFFVKKSLPSDINYVELTTELKNNNDLQSKNNDKLDRLSSSLSALKKEIENAKLEQETKDKLHDKVVQLNNELNNVEQEIKKDALVVDKKLDINNYR